MSLVVRVRSFLRNLFLFRHVESDLDQEVQSHLEMLIDQNIRAGMPPQEAHRAARIELGGVEQVKEQVRDARTGAWFDSLLQDVRFALRTLRRSPGFTAVTVFTLALGVGANTAIFSVIDAVMMGSLPVRDPQHLVVFSWTAQERPKYHGHSAYGDCDPTADCSFSVPFFQTVRAETGTFSGVAAFAGPLDIDFSGNGPASIARGQFVSGNFFSTLGVNMFLGRALGAGDDSRSVTPAIVLTYGYWQRAFGGDTSAVGRTVRLNNTPAVIVGVADRHFTSLTPGKSQDFFLPLSLCDRVRSEWWGKDDRLTDAAAWWVVILGRLHPGVSIGQAQTAATALFRNEMLHAAPPLSNAADAPAIRLQPAAQALSGESGQIAPMPYRMLFAVGFVLLVACANVAGLTLARSGTRQKEIAVRLALGASRPRIVRQLLTESMTLSLFGGALAIPVAVWVIHSITTLISSAGDERFPYVVAPDWRALAFTIGATFATGILFGLAPALRGARVDLTPSFKESALFLPGGDTRMPRWFHLGNALVVLQVMLSIVVLIGAGLLVRTVRNLQDLNPGFDTKNVLLFGINPAIAGYQDQQSAQLYRDLQQRFSALPAVISATYSEHALLSGNRSAYDVHLDGAPPIERQHRGTCGRSGLFLDDAHPVGCRPRLYAR